MEFVSFEEAMDLLAEQGLEEDADGPTRLYLRLAEDDGVVHMHLACPESQAAPRPEAQVVTAKKDQLPDIVDRIIHKLRLRQVLLVPVCKWRKVFDAVAFSMASNEDWQEVDAAATVEMNTRDPLLCEPGDFHVIKDLVRSILSDADSPEQGVMLTTTVSPFMIELVPDGALRISVGNPAMADEVAEACGAA